jgi:hypothetical protein
MKVSNFPPLLIYIGNPSNCYLYKATDAPFQSGTLDQSNAPSKREFNDSDLILEESETTL